MTTNSITAVSRATNVVTVTVQPDLVDAADSSRCTSTTRSKFRESPTLAFNGFYTVTGLGARPAINSAIRKTAAALADVIESGRPRAFGKLLAACGESFPDDVRAGSRHQPGNARGGSGRSPQPGGVASFFSLIDQSVSTLDSLKTNERFHRRAVSAPVGAAFNPG